MAKWESKQLADSGALTDLANQGKDAISALQGVLTVVQAGADMAKTFLSTVSNPAAVLVAKTADSIIAALGNYRDSGYFLLFINPTDSRYGQRYITSYGDEMVKDDNGFVVFKSSTVLPVLDTPYRGQTFEVNDEYRESLKSSDLSNNYRDSHGRTKSDPSFIWPVPELVEPRNLVLGGFSWQRMGEDGFGEPDSMPGLDAKTCIQMMADAFDDEGDIPRYQVLDTKRKIFADGSKVPYTLGGSKVTDYDNTSFDADKSFPLYRFPLYARPRVDRNGNAIPLSAREEITTQIAAGKPNYQGDTTLAGKTVAGIAFVVAAQNPTDFLDSLLNLGKLFPGLPDFSNVVDKFQKMLTPDDRKITITVDTNYGLFAKKDIIKGFDSGATGEIQEVGTYSNTVMTKTISTMSYDAAGRPRGFIDKIVDSNPEGRYKDVEIQFTPKGDPTDRFIPGEQVYEGITVDKEFSDGTKYKAYQIKGIQYKDNAINFDFTKIGIDTTKLPKYGNVKALNALVPASVEPNFLSYRNADLIPGWSEFFDGLIELANGIKGFAEDTSEFIQALIDAIDQALDFFTRLVAALTELITILTTGLPNAGIFYLGMKSSSGNEGFKAALTGADGAPDATYKFSAGLLIIGDPAVSEIVGKDPLEILFGDVLGVKFQSV